MTAPVPRSFGKYQLEREIARGGMARVHLATLRGLLGFEKKLVVKEILPELANDPRFVAMFVEEAKVLVALSHPNIVSVYELGIVDGTYFLAMEHVEGATLAELIEHGPLDAGQAARIGAQIADALAYAHERFGIVHRDVSPRNVMVDVAGHARLLDFGIAARADLDDDEALYGTPGFLSPEQARGERLTPASDLFSLGCVLHYALTGSSPLAATDLGRVRTLAHAPALELSGVGELAGLIAELLAPKPEARGSARSVARALVGLALSLDGTPEDSAAQSLSARATAVRAAAELETQAPRPRVPPDVTPGRVETLAQSQALDALLGTQPIAPPRLAVESGDEPAADGPRTQKIVRAGPGSPRSRPAPGTARLAAVGALAAAVSVGLLSFARFEATPFAPIANGDDGLVDPAAIVPLPVEAEPDTSSEADAAPTEADAGLGVLDAQAPAPDLERGSDARVRSLATGELSVRASPWAQVVLDGRSLGTTPIRRASVTAGSHALRLECPPLGRRAEVTLRVEAGRTLRVSADLERDPPVVDVAR